MPSCSCTMPAHSITQPKVTGVASQHKCLFGDMLSLNSQVESSESLQLAFVANRLVWENLSCASQSSLAQTCLLH